jgi:hypothetical protein
MSADRDMERIARSWLQEEQHENANRVLDIVLELVDTTPQRRPWWPARRYLDMNNQMRLALVAAVVAALAVIGFALAPRTNVGSEPTPAPTPTLRTLTEADVADPEGVAEGRGFAFIDAGSYQIAGPFSIPIKIDLPEGWTLTDLEPGSVVFTLVGPSRNAAIVEAVVVRDVFTDPCHDVGPTAVGPTVDDLVAALTHQVGMQTTSIRDVSINGLAGKAFDQTNQIDASTCIGDPWLWQWTYASSTGETREGTLGGLHGRITVLDVAGQRLLLVEAIFDWTTPAQEAQMDQIVKSIRTH